MSSFNPFRSRATEETLQMQRQKQHEQLQRHQQQAQMQDLESLKDYLEALMKIKSIENKMYLHCSDKCLAFDNNALQDSERDCLKNCSNKIEKFVSIANLNFGKIEGGTESLMNTYTSKKQKAKEMQENGAKIF